VAKYLVLYRASADAVAQMANTPPEQAQAGMEAWMQWAGKAGPALVDLGAPLASVAVIGSDGGTGLPIAGFSVLEADSKDAVTQLLHNHPHSQMPGPTAIEVLEFQPIPGS